MSKLKLGEFESEVADPVSKTYSHKSKSSKILNARVFAVRNFDQLTVCVCSSPIDSKTKEVNAHLHLFLRFPFLFIRAQGFMLYFIVTIILVVLGFELRACIY
jgi:hypothetical protein